MSTVGIQWKPLNIITHRGSSTGTKGGERGEGRGEGVRVRRGGRFTRRRSGRGLFLFIAVEKQQPEIELDRV